MKRITFITGPTGSGKSTFVLNYAIKIAKEINNLKLVDLDYINVYFRTRSKKKLLKKHGIEMIGSSLNYEHQADLPALSGGIYLPFTNKNMTAIFDLAGNIHGLNVVNSMKDYIHGNESEIDFWVVLNNFRNNNATAKQMIKFINDAQEKVGLKVTGIIANPHLMGHETRNDILAGLNVIKQVEKSIKTPIIYVCSKQELVEKKFLKLEVFPT